MGYVYVNNGSQTSRFQLTSTAPEPRLRAGTGYVPLVMGSTTGPQLKCQMTPGGVLRAGVYTSTLTKSTKTEVGYSTVGNAGTRTTTTSYYTSSAANSNGPYSGGVMSNVTEMTTSSTSGYSGLSTSQRNFWTNRQVNYDTFTETEIVGHANYYETYIDEQTSIIALRPGAGAETTYYRSITNTAQATVYSGYEAHTHQTDSTFGATRMYTHYTANFTYTDYDLSTTKYLSVNGTSSQQAYNEGADWDMRYANHNGAWNNGWYAYWDFARNFEDGVQFGNNTTWRQNGGNYNDGYFSWAHSVNGACQYVGLATLTLVTYTAHDVQTCYGYYYGTDYTYHTTIATTSSSLSDCISSEVDNYNTTAVNSNAPNFTVLSTLTRASTFGYSGRSSSTSTQSSTQSRSSYYTSSYSEASSSSWSVQTNYTSTSSQETTVQTSSLTSGNGYKIVGGAIVVDQAGYSSYSTTSITSSSYTSTSHGASSATTTTQRTSTYSRTSQASYSYGAQNSQVTFVKTVTYYDTTWMYL